MSLLFRVIYAAHANGTHHKLALDALNRLTRADAEAWQRVFLKHADLYLQGSKAPDNEFKDFKNHVLHVRDDYWGGAPEKVASWYQHLVTALRERNWPEAAWCAGVLSHYYTDPIHPFHTAQSEAENNIHRAVEWSINRGYDDLKREAEAAHRQGLIEAPHGPHWLRDFVCQGAETANAAYETLIAHYDINVGVVDPPAGLDPIGRDVVGRLMLYAADGFARVLERAITESEATAPDVSISVETVIATLKVPLKLVQKRLANATDRRVVEAMYDELMATGRVEAALPEDDRVVRDLHRREVIAARNDAQAEARERRLPGPLASATLKAIGPAVTPAAPAAGGRMTLVAAAPARATEEPSKTSTSSAESRFAAALTGPQRPVRPAPASLGERIAQAAAAPASNPARAARSRLAPADDIEAAPSIGPKTAERFYALGIRTVADFLAADAETAAELIDVRHITAAAIRDWQDQARLVMAVPVLNGGHAQLLVGAGYRNAASIGAADAVELSAAVLRFAATAEGQRILRDGSAPDLERITSWIAEALAVRAA